MWGNNETKLKVQRLDLLDDTITSLYLGCRIDDYVKGDLIFEIRHNFPKAKIFMSKKVKGKFALEFEQLF